MQDLRFDRAVDDVIEVIMFDQWLRHYFTTERDGKLFLEIPEEALAGIRRDHPGLFALAEPLNTKEITYQICQDNLCSFLAAHLDGDKYATGVISSVFDSRQFKIEQYVFSLWLKGHEGYLDEAVRPFAEWREMYAGWKQMDEVKDYILKLKTGAGAQKDAAGSTVH